MCCSAASFRSGGSESDRLIPGAVHTSLENSEQKRWNERDSCETASRLRSLGLLAQWWWRRWHARGGVRSLPFTSWASGTTRNCR